MLLNLDDIMTSKTMLFWTSASCGLWIKKKETMLIRLTLLPFLNFKKTLPVINAKCVSAIGRFRALLLFLWIEKHTSFSFLSSGGYYYCFTSLTRWETKTVKSFITEYHWLLCVTLSNHHWTTDDRVFNLLGTFGYIIPWCIFQSPILLSTHTGEWGYAS